MHDAVKYPLALLGALALSPGAAGQTGHLTEPADPSADVPASTYRSVFPGGESSSRTRLDERRLPWRELYRPDGGFVPESAFAGTSGDRPKSEDAAPTGQVSHETMAHGDEAAVALSVGPSDTRGVIQKIYRAEHKVKIKHEPIAKLDMPGMTMIFYLKDPALIDGVNEGEEVGFDVELDGTTFYITRFVRGAP